MAIYQPGDTAPTTPQRIDNVVWQTDAQQPSLRRWTYPTTGPTARFNQVNDFVRQLDDRWTELSSGQQDAWADLQDEEDVYARCNIDPWIMRDDITPPPGRSTHRGINLARWIQGLPYLPDAPAVGTLSDNDFIELSIVHEFPFPIWPLEGQFKAFWTGRAGPPSGQFWLFTLGYSRQTVASATEPMQHYRWIGALPIEYEVELDFTDQLRAWGKVWGECWVNFRFLIAEAGYAPFVAFDNSIFNLFSVG